MFTIQTAAQTFLANLSALEQRLDKTNEEVSSGLRVQTVSDDPEDIAEILQVNAQISANDQVKTNLGQVQTEVNAAEGAISTATTLMNNATQIAAEGSSGGSVNRAELANQVADILTSMQQIAATQVAGRYVFSGDSDQTAPYGAVNLSANPTNGVGPYLGTASTRTVINSYGVPFAVSFTAQQIFDGGVGGTPSNSVFQSLTELYNALSSNNQTAVMSAASDISSAASYLSGMDAQYGDIQNKISDALTGQSTLDTSLQAQLSNLQDADEAQAVTDQQTESTALNAAETAYAALPKKSLFDYLG
jgi:flagellar hook-associated protein 3 FlgL